MPPTQPPTEAPGLADDDARRMLRVGAGDRQAFEELYDRYASRGLAFAFRYTSDRTTAEDAVQETFLRVFRARESYVATAKFSTWFFRILVNVCLNRRRGRRPEVSLDAGPSPDAPEVVEHADPNAPDPTRSIETEETKRLVREAVAALPDRQRTAVLLQRFEGLSHAEIGGIMDLTTQAVKSLLARAREILRERLARRI